MPIESKNINFKDRFFIAMIFITMVIGGIIVTNYFLVTKETTILNAINRSSEQSMLSQRIPLLSDRILEDFLSEEERNKVLDEYAEAVSQMKLNHDFLVNGSSEMDVHTLPDTLIPFYFDEKTNLDQDVKTFLLTANEFYTALRPNKNMDNAFLAHQALYAQAPLLLTDLNYATQLYEESRENAITFLKQLQPILFIISIFCLTAIWFFVFSPLTHLLKETIQRLKTEKDDSETQKKRYDLAVQGTSTGVWDWDIETGKFYWNSVLKHILGLPSDDRNEFSTDYFQEILHPNDKDEFNASLRHHLKTGSLFYYEGRILHGLRHYVWVCFRGQALWDKNGKAYRMVGSIEDTTEKREAETQKNIFIQGIESSGFPFAILETHNSNRFSYATQKFCDLSGHDIDNLLGKNLNIFTGPETSMGDLDAIDSGIKQRKSIKIKILSYRRDGSSFWNHLTAEPIPNKYDDNKIYYAIIFNDLTESMLREKLKVQRQRNESLGALAASVAHEINNLLMPMSMAKDVLETELKEDCDPFAHEQIDTIVTYANQAKEIVNDILAFSRKETQNLENCVIYDLLQQSVSFIGGLLNANTSIVIETPENNDLKTITCLINTIEFRQIITNLAKNSEYALHGEKGEIHVSLSTKSLSNAEKMSLHVQANQYAVIHFTDNGTGIPKDILPKIFDPLFTTKDIGAGTGLGLSVVHGILQSWGGAITVESTEGVGTKFDIYIPIITDENDFDYLADLLDDA